MHLRSITLAGFKTFARQIEIAFDPGVTAIVGPNGSGKSNTVDAFKWVLGEVQARDLRGRKMEEVIYAGGQRRPRASAAEVTIVIDNSDRRLPLDYQEVAIRRRLDRSGQSAYYLNGSRVRRRDLIELLASTGLTTDSYAIVDQGDIEAIIVATPEQRRELLEAAAQVRGVKAKRSEAAAQLQQLAANLFRLEDLRTEIEPRLSALREQAKAAEAAVEASRRLELLRGSIVFEEWREARESHRRATAHLVGLTRRLEAAREAAEQAEADFQGRRREMETAQDRRLERQSALAAGRLELQRLEHEIALVEERLRGHAELVTAIGAELTELAERRSVAAAERRDLLEHVADAERALGAVPPPPPAPDQADIARAREAAAGVERARHRLGAAESALAAARTRRQLLEERAAGLRAQIEPAEAGIPAAEAAAEQARAAAEAAAEAAAGTARARAELEGLEALLPARAPGLRRVGDVLIAKPGHEAALSAVLGDLVDAWVAASEADAVREAVAGTAQTTVFYPAGAAQVEPGSIVEAVTCEAGFEDLGGRLLGAVVVGRDVSLDGVYRAPGLVRAGPDHRVRLSARRRELGERLARLEPVARDAAELAGAATQADDHLRRLRVAARERTRLESTLEELVAASAAESESEAMRVRAAGEATAGERLAAETGRLLDDARRRLIEHQSESRRLDRERSGARDRLGELRARLAAVDAQVERAGAAEAARRDRARSANEAAGSMRAALPGIRAATSEVRARLEREERESPDREAELAAAARLLVTAEETRVDARLRSGTLQANAELLEREVELSAARMEELRRRMPEGLAPDQVPGGKAREREMRHLERRLEEIGPTNALAAAEALELEDRYGNLLRQLDDIAAARADLEDLISRLREEEDSRYEAVFGAVAANFQEYFAELTAGGRATLNHAPGAEGPRSGVDILVQPPRKRMQNLTLLSSGERSMTALALVLALQEINPAPFTILDEVDAALDDANVGRFGELLHRLGRDRQLMVITHNHLTMASASALYGVHLDESGCSHLVSVRLDDVRPGRRPADEPAPAVQTA